MKHAFAKGLLDESEKLAGTGHLNPVAVRRLLTVLAKAGLFGGAGVTGFRVLKFYSDVIDDMTAYPMPVEERRTR